MLYTSPAWTNYPNAVVANILYYHCSLVSSLDPGCHTTTGRPDKKYVPVINCPRLSPTFTSNQIPWSLFIPYIWSTILDLSKLCVVLYQTTSLPRWRISYSIRCRSGAATARRGCGHAGRSETRRQCDTAVPLRPGGGQSVQRQVVQGTEGVFPLHAKGESARANLSRPGRPNQCKSDRAAMLSL